MAYKFTGITAGGLSSIWRTGVKEVGVYPGIPTPPTVLTSLHTQYAAPATYNFVGAGGVRVYEVSADGPYTHYVDPDDANATNLNNPYGTVAIPRTQLPDWSSLAPGSVVEVHNLHLTGGSIGTVTGTVDKPIFVRGPSTGTKPIWTPSITWQGVIQYLILENWDFDYTNPLDPLERFNRLLFNPSWTAGDYFHHIAIRNCVTHNFEAEVNLSLIHI